MKIGILTDQIDNHVGGIRTYTYNLIKNLNKIDKKNEYYLIHQSAKELDIYRLNKEILISKFGIPTGGGFIWRLFNLPLRLRKTDLDLVHDPAGPGLLLFDVPFKRVETIYDLTPLLFPETHNRGYVLAHKLLYPRVKNLDKVITISENSKRDIMEHLKVPHEKIRVVYGAADERFQPLEEKEVAEVKRKYSLDFPFVLSVAVLEPRKNLPTLIKSFHKLKNQGLQHRLVIGGGRGWKYKNIFRTVEGLGLDKEVIFLGYVPGEDLPKLYNAADLFVFPSIYEGFGLPPLEAMACGCPVITSNASSLPEVVGDAGIMVDPYDVDGWTEAMGEVLSNKGLRRDMRERGLERAKLFSWEKTAKETLRVYEEVYDRD
ncbi:MAG TPA: glycosyltransferase family 4 protein [Dehalococcoidia bacterium]|nr:glycosyltransferase family 4 protein [Dehalococcoidia bacterium]